MKSLSVITDNTMIVFTSDNGGLYRRYDYRPEADDNVSSQAPLKGEKGSLHGGGVRVPLIVKYPPLVKPGTVCAEPTISYDFYPTFVDMALGKLPATQTIDGLSLQPLLANPAARLRFTGTTRTTTMIAPPAASVSATGS